MLNEQDGFAFISQPDEMEGQKVPRLASRMPLSYEVSLLLVVIREALEEFDVQNTDSRTLFITNKDLKERIELFFEDKSDKVKLLERFEVYINAVVKLGFLKERAVKGYEEHVKNFEVRRIIKAKINNEKLEEIADKIQDYFDAKVQLVWYILPKQEQIYAYTSPTDLKIYKGLDICSASPVLTDFTFKINDLFAED